MCWVIHSSQDEGPFVTLLLLNYGQSRLSRITMLVLPAANGGSSLASFTCELCFSWGEYSEEPSVEQKNHRMRGGGDIRLLPLMF